MNLIPKNQYKRSAWKNGLGYTDEIAIYPPEARLVEGNFLWRLSTARIEKDSAFSPFPNHDRILIILSGNGVRLSHAFEGGGVDDVVEIPRYEPYEFPGDISSHCELLNGPVTDFSIFLRKGEVEAQAEVKMLEAGHDFNWSAPGKWNFIFVIKGSAQMGNFQANEKDTFSTTSAEILRSKTGAELLLISLS